MKINHRHHQSLLQRQDRILTGNYKLQIVEYVTAEQGGPTAVQTDGQNIAINYELVINDLSDPVRLAAAAGANAHALGHNLRTPRVENQLHKEFEKNGKLWRQAFNIAEDWRIECHVVDDSHVNGPYLAALFNVMDGLIAGVYKDQYSDLDRFILLAGRLYLADETIMGRSHVDYLRTLRDIAANDPIWENGKKTVGDIWNECQMTNHMTDSCIKIVLEQEDLHFLTGRSWADALIDHAVMYHNKLWAMKHLGHTPDDTHLIGSDMINIINRIMVLILPSVRVHNFPNGSSRGMLRNDGTNPHFELWQDVTFGFEKSRDDGGQGNGNPSDTGNPGNGGKNPSSDDTNGKPGESGNVGRTDPKPPGEDAPRKSGRGEMAEDLKSDCRCGTCGR